jgi:hypothetical protein
MIKSETLHPKGVGVRLLIFSGRADPTWELEATEISELQQRLSNLLGIQATHAPPPGGLGYRGFLVSSDRPLDKLPQEFSVFRSTVTITTGRQTQHWRDQGLELWFLQQAVSLGYRDVLEKFAGLDVEAILRAPSQGP